MITRLHRIDDLAALFDMAIAAAAEGQYKHYPFNDKKFWQLAELATFTEEVFCVVAEAAGTLRGFLLGYVTEHHFIDVTYAADIAFYVAPKFRGRSVGAALVREYEVQARLRGAQQTWLGASSGIEPMRTLEFYNSLGYATVGGLAIKSLGESHVG